jgi:hypothetical protein
MGFCSLFCGFEEIYSSYSWGDKLSSIMRSLDAEFDCLVAEMKK